MLTFLNSDLFNYIMGSIFLVIGVYMLIRWLRVHKRIMIKDQQWGYIRIGFLVIGLLSMVNLVMNMSTNRVSDYYRIACTMVAVTAFLAVHDGIGEEGVVSGSKFYPWSVVRAWDLKEEKNFVAVYFMMDSDNPDKPDEYTTKELDFANEDKEYVKKFLNMNVGRKYTRMKRKS